MAKNLVRSCLGLLLCYIDKRRSLHGNIGSFTSGESLGLMVDRHAFLSSVRHGKLDRDGEAYRCY